MATRFSLERSLGNRRKDVRLKTQLPARLRVVKEGKTISPDIITCVTSDISLHGTRLVVHSSKPITNNTRVELFAGKSFLGWKYRFDGIIRWIQHEPGMSHGILGVFFRDVPASMERAWAKFLRKEARRLRIPLEAAKT